MHDVVVATGVDAETLGEPTIVGVLENLTTAADHDGYLLGPQLESFEQRAGVGIAVDVEVHVRPAVAGQEFANPQCVARLTGTEHDYVTEPGFQNAHAAQNEGAHEELAELGVVLHYSAKTLETHREHTARLTDAELGEA